MYSKLNDETLFLTAAHISLIFLAFIVAVIFVIVLKKIYYRFRFQKRYYIFPRIGVKGIANIAMVVSIAIAAILLLTLITAGFMGILFRAYPGWRVNIEGILIKIGGLLFGPIIGLFVGICTDLLSVALTAGMFHYGYFLAAMGYGFFSGLVRTAYNVCRGKQVQFVTVSSLAVIAIFALTAGYIAAQPVSDNGYFVFEFLSKSINISRMALTLIVASVFGTGLIILWLCMWIYNSKRIIYSFSRMGYWMRYRFKMQRYRRRLMYADDIQSVSNRQLKWYTKISQKEHLAAFKLNNQQKNLNKEKTNWFSYLAPVLITILTCEAIIEIFMLPVFDIQFSTIPYTSWLILRTIMLVPIALLNTAIIYPVYRIVSPSMHYDYQNDIIENVSVPLSAD